MGLGAFLGGDAVQVDAAEREENIRSENSDALLDDEKVVFAFHDRGGKGRDSFVFTTKRLLIENKKGMTGKRIEFTTVPYHSIRSFAIETAGSMDNDVELKIYARGINRIKLDFVTDVDIFAVNRFLSYVVLAGNRGGYDADGVAAQTSVDESGGGLLDFFGSDFAQLDSDAVEAKLKGSLLVEGESVEMAFQCGRDSFVLTSERILKIDVQGVSGKRVEYKTILWSTVRGFSVETAGNILDRDSELKIFLNTPQERSRTEGHPSNSETRMIIDFRHGKVDLFAVQRYFSDKILGPDPAPASESAAIMTGVQDKGSGSPLAWMGDDSRMVDAAEADSQFRFLLQSNESVDMAFKGRRDMMLFTGKRIIQVDVQGFMGMGKKTEFLSFPWTTITAFSVRTAGSMDKDSEMCLWMDFDDVFNPNRTEDEDPQPPPISRRSYIEVDFQKSKVDMMVIHRYLSERVNRWSGHQLRPFDMPVSSEVLASKSPGVVDSLMNWIGNDAAGMDASEVDAQFHDSGVLVGDEHVAFAFKSGRDSFYMTNKRVISFDTQGMSGKRREYMSVPYDSIRVWAVESAGSFDRDMEIQLWFKGYWKDKIEQDLRTGKADINALNNIIAHFVIGNADGDTALELAKKETDSNSIEGLLSYITDDGVAKDTVAMTQMLRTSPPILQGDESVDAAYKSGRDLLILTTKRTIVIDKKGMSGKRVQYKSYPHMYNKAFKIQTEGHMMSGPEFSIYTNEDDIEQELAKGSSDIWKIHRILSTKMLEESYPEIEDTIATFYK